MTEDRSQKASDRAFYVETLKSEECLCGRVKKPGNSFCFRCFKSLPTIAMRMSMYRTIGAGYEEAFEEAVAWLQTEVW